MSGSQRVLSSEIVPLTAVLAQTGTPPTPLTDAICKVIVMRDSDGWVLNWASLLAGDPSPNLPFYDPDSPAGGEIDKKTLVQVDSSRAPGRYLYNLDMTDIAVITANASGRDSYSTSVSVVADIGIDTVDFANNELDIASHEFEDGDGPVQLTTTTTLPTGLALLTDYWTIFTDGGTIQLATSRANALLGTAVTFSDAGTGTHTVTTQGPMVLTEDGEIIINSPDMVASAHTIIDIVESHRGAQTHQNDVWYVSPNDGSDSNHGKRDAPFATTQAAIDAASPHDTIFLLADAPAGLTTETTASKITINKRYLFIRGPGGDYRIQATAPGDLFEITADGVELSGFRAETAATGAGRAITLTAVDYARVHNVMIDVSRGDAILVNNCNYCQIHHNVLRGAGLSGAGHGIHIDSSGADADNHVEYNRIYNTQGDAVRITGASTDHTVVCDNKIDGSSGWGVNVVAGSNTVVCENALHNNNGLHGDDAINDGGTDTHIHNNDDYATNGGVWDVALAGHLAAGTTGAALDAISAAGIAIAVWDAPMASHRAAGTFGLAVAVIRGVLFGNYTYRVLTRADDSDTEGAEGLPLTWEVKVWASAADVPANEAAAETGTVLGTFSVAAEADGSFPSEVNFMRSILTELP